MNLYLTGNVYVESSFSRRPNHLHMADHVVMIILLTRVGKRFVLTVRPSEEESWQNYSSTLQTWWFMCVRINSLPFGSGLSRFVHVGNFYFAFFCWTSKSNQTETCSQVFPVGLLSFSLCRLTLRKIYFVYWDKSIVARLSQTVISSMGCVIQQICSKCLSTNQPIRFTISLSAVTFYPLPSKQMN